MATPRTNRPLVSMAEQFTGLPMDSLIGGPLNAAATANASMAATQTKFLLDTCFQKDGDNYKPILIKMELTQAFLKPEDPSKPDSPTTIEQVKTTFDLPILTILPLNSLAVDSVDITFDMEVKSSFSEATNEASEEALAAEASWEAKVGWGPFSASITGSVSYDSKSTTSHDTHYEKSNSAQYSVKVHAGQIPLPSGVTTIIQAFTASMTPTEMPKTVTGPGPVVP